MWFIPHVLWATAERIKLHNHELKADKRLIFTLYVGEDSSRDAKIHWKKKMPLLFFLLFFNSLLALVAFTSFFPFLIMLVYQNCTSNLLFVVNARNSLMSLAVSSDWESEIETFITQTKAALVAVLQLSFRTTTLNLHLRVRQRASSWRPVYR